MLSTIFPIVLVLAALLTALVAGFLLAFAIVAMPGIKNLHDAEFIRAFQGMDGIIQNNQPIFMLVWLGAVLAILAAAVIGFGQLDTVGRGLIIVATLLYIFGVQLPTIVINVPLNNQLQTLQVETMSESEQATARLNFEARWNLSNNIRTGIAILASALLIILLYLL